MAKILSLFLIVVSRTVDLASTANLRLTTQQASCGIFLKLHIFEKSIRRVVKPIHSVIGKAFPVLGWTRMFHSSRISSKPYCVRFSSDTATTSLLCPLTHSRLTCAHFTYRKPYAAEFPEILFGVATALSFCRDGNLGQCAAHYLMGSAFIAYAAILVIMLNVGGRWLEKVGCSQEMLDSSVIMVWVGLPVQAFRVENS